jgi:hypothetical protein
MGLGLASPITGMWDSVLGSGLVCGWERGVIPGGDHLVGDGITTTTTTTSASITSIFITIGGLELCIASTTMVSTRGMAGNGRTTGAAILLLIPAAALITRAHGRPAATMEIFTRVVRNRPRRALPSNIIISTLAETAVSIAPTRPALGSEIAARPGNARQKLRGPLWSNTPSATTWANSGSITSAPMAAGLAILAEAVRWAEAIRVEEWAEAMAVEAAATVEQFNYININQYECKKSKSMADSGRRSRNANRARRGLCLEHLSNSSD